MFYGALGYALPYPTRASFESLPLNVRTDIFGTCFPTDQFEQEHDHYCSRLYPCADIFAILQPFRGLGLVCKQWHQEIGSVQKMLLKDKVWSNRFNLKTDESAQASAFLSGMTLIDMRFRITNHIEIDENHQLGVFLAEDVGTPKGCFGKETVVLKVFAPCRSYRSAYFRCEWLGYSKTLPEGFARLIKMGKTHTQSHWMDPRGRDYIAMQRLGPSLEKIRQLHQSPLPLKLVLAVAIQMLHRYEALHALDIVHNGSKPGNICISPPPANPSVLENELDRERCRLYLIDFDMAGEKKQGNDWRLNGNWGSNPAFASIWWHVREVAPCPRTDLEALAHTLVYLAKGTLPWLSDPDKSLSTPIATACEGLDPVFADFLRETRCLVFNERPEYAALRARFAQVWVREAFGDVPGDVDWWTVYESLLAKDEERQRAAREGQEEK